MRKWPKYGDLHESLTWCHDFWPESTQLNQGSCALWPLSWPSPDPRCWGFTESCGQGREPLSMVQDLQFRIDLLGDLPQHGLPALDGMAGRTFSWEDLADLSHLGWWKILSLDFRSDAFDTIPQHGGNRAMSPSIECPIQRIWSICYSPNLQIQVFPLRSST